jgi:hypothetical protein
LTLGQYKNFPSNIHAVESFTSVLSSKKLQEKLIETLCAINQKEYTFEEVSIPTVPDGKVIFEFGLAEDENFNYIDRDEVKKALDLIVKGNFETLDFFCCMRYYEGKEENKRALKFDYCLLRTVFGKELFEIQVFHERGPRYLSPEDLIYFVFNEINKDSSKKILKKTSFNP